MEVFSERGERKLARRKEVTGSQPSLPGRPDNTFWTALPQPPFPEGPQAVQYPQVRIQPMVAGDRGCLPLYKGQGGLCLPGFLLTGPELGCGRTSGRRSRTGRKEEAPRHPSVWFETEKEGTVMSWRKKSQALPGGEHRVSVWTTALRQGRQALSV